MSKKAQASEVIKLVYQFVYLAGGPKNSVSIYEIARPRVCEILGLSPVVLNPSSIVKNNYAKLKIWMDENHPNCPTRVSKAKKNCPKTGGRKERTKKIKPKSFVRITNKPAPSEVTVRRFVNATTIDPNGEAFLSSFEWKATRMMALKRYGPVCQCCGASPKTGAVVNVDHIKPRKLFPELALSVDNLQILCGDCNHGKGNWDTTDWRTSKVG